MVLAISQVDTGPRDKPVNDVVIESVDITEGLISATQSMIKVISWNIATRREPWRQLVQMDADVALLQEATPPPDDVVRLRDSGLPLSEGYGRPGYRPARSVGLRLVELRLVAREVEVCV